MLFNLVQYLRTNFPTETIYANSMHLVSGSTIVPDRLVVVRDTGGVEQPWTRYSQPTVQIWNRDNNAPASRKLAYDIYDHIQSHQFGLILPAITVGTDTYSAVQIGQISAIQEPFLLETDENGRVIFTTNYKIIYERGD